MAVTPTTMVAISDVYVIDKFGFVMARDYKWRKGAGIEEMHYLTMVTDRSLRSIRDLRGRHVPMLTRMKQMVTEYISKTHGLPKSKVRAYFHYFPTFWHLHVHFAYTNSHSSHADVNLV